MFSLRLQMKYSLCVNLRLYCKSSTNVVISSVKNARDPQFGDRILTHIRTSGNYIKSTTTVDKDKFTSSKLVEAFDEFLYKSAKSNRHPSINLSIVSHISDPNFLQHYIMTLRQRKLWKDVSRSLARAECDYHCSTLSQLQRTNTKLFKTINYLQLLDAWMVGCEPNYFLVAKLKCYPSLLQEATRQLLLENSKKKSYSLLHLIFIAGLGKRNFTPSHESLGTIITYCLAHPQSTYQTWNLFELSFISLSCVRTGIKIRDELFLSYVSKVLSEHLESINSESEFDSFVVITILKLLRQANHIELRLMNCISSVIMKTKNEFDMSTLAHFTSAFVGCGKHPNHLKPSTKDRNSLDVPLTNVLQRIENMSASVIVKDKKSRLKDFARWIGACASLHYHINLATFEKDLTLRFSDFLVESQITAAGVVKILLGLAILAHYPEMIVNKVLRSRQFLSDLNLKCLDRPKARFGLFLTALKMERPELWDELSIQEQMTIEGIAKTGWNESDGWTSKSFPSKDKATVIQQTNSSITQRLLYNDSRHIATEDDDDDIDEDSKDSCMTHKELLNQCLEALKVVFCAKNNGHRAQHDGHYSGVQVLRGYALPYLNIAGIKLDFIHTGQTVYIEVVDTESFSLGLLQLKLRLLSQITQNVIQISPQQITRCQNLTKFFIDEINRLGLFQVD